MEASTPPARTLSSIEVAHFKEVIEIVRMTVQDERRASFEAEWARMGSIHHAQFLGDPLPLELHWQGVIVETFDFCCKWVKPQHVTPALFNEYEKVTAGLLVLFEKIGQNVTGEELPTILAARRLHWRAEALEALGAPNGYRPDVSGQPGTSEGIQDVPANTQPAESEPNKKDPVWRTVTHSSMHSKRGRASRSQTK